MTDTYTATLEDNTQAEEQATFKNYSRVTADVYDHTDAGTTYDKAQLLNGGNNSQVGLTKSFAVMPGDVVSVEVFAKYFESTGGSGNLSGFAAALLSAFGLPTPAGGESGTAAAAIQSYGAFIAGGGNSGTSGWPKGWLNMLVFDKDYNLVDLAFEQVDATFGQPIGNPNKLQMQELTATKTIKEPGYVYIYLSNEGNVQQDIYFDDLKITHEKTRVIQTDDYYPFGLTFNSSRRENSVTNAYQYNGKEMQDELGLGMLDYGARMYMSDIGRWGVVDPLAEKARRWSPYTYVYDNPLRFIDPDGMEGMGISLTTGGSLGGGNAIEHRRWMDERDERFAKRRVGVGGFSGSSEMEQTVQDKPQYWGSQPGPGVAGGMKRKKKKAGDAQQGLPSPQELNDRFGESFSDWINGSLIPHFVDMPFKSLSPTEKMDAVMGYILLQDFPSMIMDARETGKHYLTLVEVRMKLIENGPPRRTTSELTEPLMEYQPLGGRILGSPGLGTPGTVHNPGTGIISIPVDANHTLNILMEFNYLVNY